MIFFYKFEHDSDGGSPSTPTLWKAVFRIQPIIHLNILLAVKLYRRPEAVSALIATAKGQADAAQLAVRECARGASARKHRCTRWRARPSSGRGAGRAPP